MSLELFILVLLVCGLVPTHFVSDGRIKRVAVFIYACFMILCSLGLDQITLVNSEGYIMVARDSVACGLIGLGFIFYLARKGRAWKIAAIVPTLVVLAIINDLIGRHIFP